MVYAGYTAVGRHPEYIPGRNLVVKPYPGSTSFNSTILFCACLITSVVRLRYGLIMDT